MCVVRKGGVHEDARGGEGVAIADDALTGDAFFGKDGPPRLSWATLPSG
jgi:hypothetical protein